MTFFGLPLHPLVVHAAVVLLPLAALGALVIALSARARKSYGWPVVVAAFVAAGAVVAARLSGEDLLQTIPLAGQALTTHMTWGLLAPWPAGALALTTLFLVLAGRGRSRPLLITAALLTVLAALASLAVIVIVGHSGSTAVWGGVG